MKNKSCETASAKHVSSLKNEAPIMKKHLQNVVNVFLSPSTNTRFVIVNQHKFYF